ncbi:MAG: L-rhamnose mutarotase [Planctomycetota bacterium]
MKSYAQALDLKDDPELIEAYRQHHRHVWPEVIEALKTIGIVRMRIFLLGTRLFMYFEAPDDFDPARDFQNYTATNRAREWDDLMRTFQRKLPEAAPGDWWAPMEPVFDLDWF